MTIFAFFAVSFIMEILQHFKVKLIVEMQFSLVLLDSTFWSFGCSTIFHTEGKILLLKAEIYQWQPFSYKDTEIFIFQNKFIAKTLISC
jgi:hypothetical protein